MKPDSIERIGSYRCGDGDGDALQDEADGTGKSPGEQSGIKVNNILSILYGMLPNVSRK